MRVRRYLEAASEGGRQRREWRVAGREWRNRWHGGSSCPDGRMIKLRCLQSLLLWRRLLLLLHVRMRRSQRYRRVRGI